VSSDVMGPTYQAPLFSTGANRGLEDSGAHTMRSLKWPTRSIAVWEWRANRLYFLPDDGAMQRTYSATTGSACVTAVCKKCTLT
jgi:hypothetical protein